MTAESKPRWGAEYQEGYSSATPGARKKMYDVEGRRLKADKVLAVIRDHFGSLGHLEALDLGCSTGIMASYYAEELAHVTGIDIDEDAVAHARRAFARPNLTFEVRDGLSTGFPEGSFDVITCAHVYEHVPEAERLFAEIHRLLKPGGVCYFAGTNRLNLIEPHYGRLPFLSLLPRPLANLYVRVLRRSDRYYEKPRTLWGLRRLTAGFQLIDYTRRIIASPEQFKATDQIPPHSLVQRAALLAVDRAYWLFPTYVWLLRKPPAGAPARVPVEEAL
jgi:SAM-dependent methyltransferase